MSDELEKRIEERKQEAKDKNIVSKAETIAWHLGDKKKKFIFTYECQFHKDQLRIIYNLERPDKITIEDLSNKNLVECLPPVTASL